MNKRINGFFKITAVCLCIVMFIAAVPVGAFALPNYDAQEIFNAFKNFTIENIPDSLKSGLIDLNDAVRIEQPDGYDVNSLILDFGDGEKTLYQYDEPIKFTDEEGYVHFIDSSLKSTVKCKNLLEWYAFENTANSVKTYFPWYVSTGVLTEFDGYSFEIIPAADINSRAVRPESSDITVEYPNAFGKGTTLQYVSLNDGVKENIILNSYNGKTVYEYKIRANGLTPKLTPDGDISLVNENHDVVFTISKVIMFDSAEVPNHSDNNSYELTEQKNGMWTLRVLLDDNFLNDENTVYPVTVDPSATTGNSNTAFDNQTYYSDNTNEHYDLFSSIGISENSYEHVTYLRLNDMTPFVAINPAKITGATLTLYSNSSSPSYDIDAFAYNFNPDVDIDSLEWLDIIDVQQAPDFYTTATLSDKVTLNIKSLFIAWLTAETKYYSRTNTMYKKDGLFLRASFDSYSVSPYKPLYFENVNSSIKAPCLTVSYVEDVSLETGYYYIQSGYYYEDARYLTSSSNGLAIYDYTGDANQIWYVASNYDYAPAEDLYGDYRIYNVSSMGYTECGSGNSVHLSNYQSDSFLWNEDCSFKILDQSNGYKRIVNLNDGSPVTLEVRNYSKDNGAPIVTNTVKGLDNQRWKFKKIEKVAVPVGSTSQTMVVGQNPKIISYMLSMNVGSTSDVTVTSSNSDVVSVTEHTLYGTSVNDHGNITLSANAPGSAVITARAAVTNDFNQTVYYNTYWNITVEGQSISLAESSINIYVGKHYDLEATTNLIGAEVTWSSSDTSVATVSSTGRVTAVGVGYTYITASLSNGASASCLIKAYDPNLAIKFIELIDNGFISNSNIISTDDGFSYCNVSIGSLIDNANVNYLICPAFKKNTDEIIGTEPLSGSGFFDDWYIYSIRNNDDYVYGLLKMREQEHDHNESNDYDDPGVAIAFISYDISTLLNCLYHPTDGNRETAGTEIYTNIFPGRFGTKHDEVLKTYFSDPASDASYLIAEEYIDFLVNVYNSNVIALPENYNELIVSAYDYLEKSLVSHRDGADAIYYYGKYTKCIRVSNAVDEYNQLAGGTIVYDNAIHISDINNLSYYEKYIIFASHTANVNFNSFAAEVKYHSDMTYDDQLDSIYYKAIIADMEIGEAMSDFSPTHYYDLDSDIVLEQVEYHGEC